ncbi:MAG: UDP-N-acetylglucosamine 2-epimerase [Ignavibacteriales bacterium]|nr:UDP-N-acetylglucosamine 2-epimerase [Ignavibacteriales bacterium]MCB9217909.1 UDP-N-acetylglucosamine 2-epimerase [Ignavibacteriales bacterium]
MNKALFICGSLNQTTMMHKISKHLKGYEAYFTPYYDDGFIGYLAERNLLEFTILGNKLRNKTLDYLIKNKLNIDPEKRNNKYDVVFTCSDLIIPHNIRNDKIILIQEGMTDPENLMYYLVKYLGLPRYLASTSTTGLSDAYKLFFVASEGYRKLFIKKGVKPEKIVVTGIPNFDNVKQFLNNDFSYKNYVLVATSDSRETFKVENRKRFLEKCLEIAKNKQLIFKLHPNENISKATDEIKKYAPNALVFSDGNVNHMIANCDVLVTQYSTVVYIGIALGKEVYSYFDVNQLKELTPIQNNGTSAEIIAQKTIEYLKAPYMFFNYYTPILNFNNG